MLQRYVHSTGSATGTIEVTDLDTNFIAAVSTSTSTSFAQESAGTASIDVGIFFSSASIKGLPFNSLHVLSGSPNPFVERTTLGLIFRDQWNRPDAATLGNDWDEQANIDLSADRWRHTVAASNSSHFTGSLTANRLPVAGALNLPSEYMVQGNVDVAASANLNIGIRDERLGGASTFYVIFLQNFENLRRVTKFTTGSEEFNQTAAFSPALSTFYGERIILEETGSQVAISGTFTVALASSTDLTQPFTDQILSFLDTTTVLPENNQVAIGAFDTALLDEFIIQGTKVVVNLPSGFKARLDNDTAVVESGGSASISVRTRALPYATMSVLNASDVVQAQVFPQSASLSDGWGGDIYNFTQFPPASALPVIEALLTGSFVSGSIFGGDKYRYVESESVVIMGQSSSMFLINVTASLVPSISFAIVLSPAQPTGAAAAPAGPTVPTEGQIFPRGV